MARHPGVTGKKSPQSQAEVADKPPAHAPPPPVEPACFSIASFCAAHHLSQAMYHKMKSEGWGPKEARVGARVLITFEAAAAWRAAREAATAGNPPSPKSAEQISPSAA